MAHSSKTNERRLPIHPHHFSRIDDDLQQRIRLEHGYGDRFGVPDEQLAPFVGGFATREELIAESDVILLPKPLASDVAQLREGQVLWGWPHCVQDAELTQHAIDRHLTLIAFEAMNHWTAAGAFSLHVFHKNNELAGYSSVLHALQLVGSTGDYGRKLNAVVIGFGATARGAVTALNAQGIHDVDVLTGRGVTAVGSPIHSARMLQVEHDAADSRNSVVLEENGPVPLAGFLAGHDLIVNCILQDPNEPVMFLVDSDLPSLAPGTLIVDVSCDEGMGFSWARPTSFDDPMFRVGNNVRYYGVDHSPSYLWDSATWEVSEALLPYLRTVLDGPTAWENDDVLRYAVEISEGVIRNPSILAFQGRTAEYPHPRS
ncbi:N(5)-(carboxyethyl)ornithine synthase [uncultured Arthrobacter sp.]|uniref:N(5)-(carboxyethyl)ornithine synthase n=1 Tax=uncultured Arthrobacter sp. TaxID=114050 RepID=UPI00262A7404|nr:N(5)-(carboxyethyl)ornithine synthase [uncultured Arthrobacter sp.]